jgi:ring-1,2-phenylacetyl-CoA epoxidase subunit PaaC
MNCSPAHFDCLLRLGDSSLVLGQRMAEWIGHGPVLEEDIALANVGLDLVGQARMLLSHAGALEGRGRDEDALAMLREVHEYRNYTLCELPNGEPVSQAGATRDFAFTLTRNFLFAAFQCELWAALGGSTDPELAAIAAKSAKESRYHLAHASEWMLRLGDGTEESHRRMQAALDLLWPYTQELFAPDPAEAALAAAGIAPRSETLRAGWLAAVVPVLDGATLARPADSGFMSSGRRGVHSEHLGHLLAQMQFLQRAYPGAQW